MRRWVVGTATFAAILVATLVSAYACRRAIAGALIERYLATFGVPSKIDVARLDPHIFVADARLGPTEVPDASATIDASIEWAGLTPAIRSLHITSARVLTRFDGHHLSMGAEDRLVDFVLNRPRHGTPPDITVDEARVRIDSPQGRVELTLDAVLEAGVPRALRATLLPGELRAPNFVMGFLGGTARVKSNSDGLDVQAEVTGRVSGSSSGTTGRIEHLKLHLEGSKLELSTAGGFNLRGHLNARAEAEGVESGGAAAGRVVAVVEAPDSHLSDSNVETDVAADLYAEDLSFPLEGGTAVLRKVKARVRAGLKSSVQGPEVNARADLHLTGELSEGVARRFAFQVPLLGSDPNNRSTLIKAMRSLEATVEGVGATYSTGRLGLSLEKPASLAGANGVRLTLEPQARTELLRGDMDSGEYRGAFKLALEGGGGPSVSIAVPAYSSGGGPRSVSAQWTAAARLSAAPLRRLAFTAKGTLRSAGGNYTLFIQDCAQVSLAGLTLGKTNLVDVKTQLCDARAPWLVVDERRWEVHSMWRALSAHLPSANISISDGTGRLDLSGDTTGLSNSELKLTALQLLDANTTTTRFAPLSAQGNFTMKDLALTGALDVGLVRDAHPLGRVTLQHSLSTGSGRAHVEVSGLEFVTGGLQPAMLSPLLQSLARAHGHTAFDGAFAWTDGRLSSHGLLRLENWGFSSAAGDVTQVNANLELTSLLPLRSAPHQLVSVGKIDAVLPLTEVSGHFELLPTALSVEDTRMNFADGTIMLGPARVPFDPKAQTSATVRLQDVDLNKVVAATSLADRLKLDVRVSGTIPLSKNATGLEVTHGFFSSTGPGRIEISRRIWSADAEKESNAIRDFAYQALEHLAVDGLDGTINSLPEGRLGVVLHIRGRHDPAVSAPTRIGILAFLRGHAFDHPVPLPKGTPIDLTLDSSLNFEGLLDTLRATSSAVHP